MTRVWRFRRCLCSIEDVGHFDLGVSRWVASFCGAARCFCCGLDEIEIEIDCIAPHGKRFAMCIEEDFAMWLPIELLSFSSRPLSACIVTRGPAFRHSIPDEDVSF